MRVGGFLPGEDGALGSAAARFFWKLFYDWGRRSAQGLTAVTIRAVRRGRLRPYYYHPNHATASLYADAFAADPKLGDDLEVQHRYSAACCAALAAAGTGEDAARLDDKERARLRKQGLDWLRADLALYTKLSASGAANARPLVQQRMRHWQRDTDLAGIRDKPAMAKLPAEEEQACTQLWADVAALLKKAERKTK
jgi:hypothetical protein